MIYAILEAGVCVNAIAADADYAADTGAVPLPEGFWIGSYYDGSTWHPEKPTTETQLLGQEVTDLHLSQIEQGQLMTDLQLQIMEAHKNV